ncbi:hypothetical protein B0A55_12725, partial [Friedmanniomyces simplex]
GERGLEREPEPEQVLQRELGQVPGLEPELLARELGQILELELDLERVLEPGRVLELERAQEQVSVPVVAVALLLPEQPHYFRARLIPLPSH